MKYAYLGTSEFAAIVLRGLVAGGQKPALVVTPPDRRKGRGRQMSPPPAAVAATELGLTIHQSSDVNSPESRAALSEASIGTAMVCAFGQLIKPPLLDEVEMLNVHPSLLPRWRGAAPIERAIMAGDEVTGVAIIKLTEGLDSGPVALLERMPIEHTDDFASLSERLAQKGGEMAAEALAKHEAGTLEFSEQGEDGVTYAEKIDGSERRLDTSESAESLARKVRALTPHVGTHVVLAGGSRLGVLAAGAVPGDLEPGVAEGGSDAILIGTPEGVLQVTTVKPEGKSSMAAADYLRGNPDPALES